MRPNGAPPYAHRVRSQEVPLHVTLPIFGRVFGILGKFPRFDQDPPSAWHMEKGIFLNSRDEGITHASANGADTNGYATPAGPSFRE